MSGGIGSAKNGGSDAGELLRKRRGYYTIPGREDDSLEDLRENAFAIEPEPTKVNMTGLSSLFGMLTVAASAFMVSYAVMGVPKVLCESQAPRITASTYTNIFNRCTKTLPDGTVVMWNGNAQHEQDIAAGVALKLE